MLTISTRERYYSKTGVSNIYTSIRNHVVTQEVTERVNWDLTLWSEKNVLMIRNFVNINKNVRLLCVYTCFIKSKTTLTMNDEPFWDYSKYQDSEWDARFLLFCSPLMN